MNLIEAVKSGKRFRRKDHWGWVDLETVVIGIAKSDILATDWEIEERKIEITESELEAALEASGFKGMVIEELRKRLFGGRDTSNERCEECNNSMYGPHEAKCSERDD